MSLTTQKTRHPGHYHLSTAQMWAVVFWGVKRRSNVCSFHWIQYHIVTLLCWFELYYPKWIGSGGTLKGNTHSPHIKDANTVCNTNLQCLSKSYSKGTAISNTQNRLITVLRNSSATLKSVASTATHACVFILHNISEGTYCSFSLYYI